MRCGAIGAGDAAAFPRGFFWRNLGKFGTFGRNLGKRD